MTKYNYAKRVVEKVKKLLKYSPTTNDILTYSPTITLDENYKLDSVVWTYYETTIIVTSTEVTVCGRNDTTILFEYDGYDELLSF